jgi:excisionase family DNA binding protein
MLTGAASRLPVDLLFGVTALPPSVMADRRPPTTSDEFLTVAEIAQTLRLNQQTVRNWINTGMLPAVHIGRRVRITRGDLERVIEQGYLPGKAGADATGQAFWGGEQHAPADVAE